MVDKYSFIDETKIAVSGVSYGGYVVGMMLAASGEKHGEVVNVPLRCGISVSPVVEWRYYGKFQLIYFQTLYF